MFALMKGGHLCITTPVGEGELVSPALVPARPRSSPIRERHGTTCADMSETLPQPFMGMPQREASFFATLLSRTADTRNLRMAWDYLASNGGQAPGPDGLHYDDLDDREIWTLLRDSSEDDPRYHLSSWSVTGGY